jgi:hypothetical protein
MDHPIGRKEIAVNNTVHVHPVARKTQLVQLDGAMADLVVSGSNVLVHDSHFENHILEILNVFPCEGFSVDGVQVIGFDGRYLVPIVAIHNPIVLLEFEANIGIGLSNPVCIGKVGGSVEVNGKDSHVGLLCVFG